MKKKLADRGQGIVGIRYGHAPVRKASTIRCPLSAVPLALVFLLLCQFVASLAVAVEYPPVKPDYRITFPADEGSHPEFRTEWWYVTGWMEDGQGVSRGFQVTFFRHRPGIDEDNPSRFAARQLLFAHAAISDPQVGRLLHDERSARAGFGLAEASDGRAEVVLEDWSLRQEGDRYRVRVPAKDFALELELVRTQQPLLQGIAGFSQKGPARESASHYYSQPQLAVTGRATVQGKALRVQGKAWFDHEWSSTLLDEAAQGWDWLGINLDDGGALMVFRMRDTEEGQHWAGGSSRSGGDGNVVVFEPRDIEWQALRRWRSPRTAITYPVEWRVRAGDRWYTVRPLLDDQESDSRRSTGTLYWEGAVELIDAGGQAVGRGYLELTGYGNRLRF